MSVQVVYRLRCDGCRRYSCDFKSADEARLEWFVLDGKDLCLDCYVKVAA